MVSFWPFRRRDDNSPQSFKEALGKMDSQIKATSAKLTTLRERSRRYKALLMLYFVVGYIFYAVVVFVLVGYQNIGPKEGAGLAGGPLGIYLVRKLMSAYYDRRINYTESYLEEQQAKQRDKIEQLKTATNYSTTLEIIEKYGGASEKKALKSAAQQAPKLNTPQRQEPNPQQQQQQQNTPPLQPLTPQQRLIQQQLMEQQRSGAIPGQRIGQPPIDLRQPPQPLQMQAYSQPLNIHYLRPDEDTGPKWYDRIMDLIIGPDETSAKERYALICKSCRMVNGLAPPGTKCLEEIDEWGCARCGTMNGRKPELKPADSLTAHLEEPRPKTPIVESEGENPGVEEDGEEDDSVVVPKTSSDQGEELPKANSKVRGTGRRKA